MSNINKMTHRKLFPLLIPNTTAFMAGFCVMVVELVAARIIARYLGVSIYTWTSVIGIVLGGIALGNYIGGRIADRFNPKKAISVLFIAASASCVFVPALNNLVGNSTILLQLSWPARVTSHVAMIFFLPSCILGMVSPVVAKFALDQGLTTGRTIGNIYAWSAGGSIAGTFVTGFFLIAHIGTIAVVWTVAGILGFVGLLYGVKTRLPYIWATAFIILVFLSYSSCGWAYTIGQQLALREATDPRLIYQAESQYSSIRVEHLADSPNVRILLLDQLLHSIIRLDDPTSMQNLYPYQGVYEAITNCYSGDKERLHAFIIGGGGYVFPRYIEKHWPGSRIDVAEIDPAVTEAAVQAFGLSRESSIHIHHLDARNYIEDLLQRRRRGEVVPGFDFIYGDAFNDFSVPFQLVTHEFNEKVRRLLAPDGIYMITVADSIQPGQFLGATVNTLEKTFPYVYVYLPEKSSVSAGLSNTFVVAGSLRQINLDELKKSGFTGSQLEESQLKLLKKRSGGIVLTDDYVPVENLLAPVIRQRGLRMGAVKFTDLGNSLIQEGNSEKAIKYYHKALQIEPSIAEAWNNLGNVLARKGKLKEALDYYNKALEIAPELAETHSNIAAILSQQGKFDEAVGYYRKALQLQPDTAETHYNLGVTLASQGKLKEAAEHYRKALQARPDLAQAHNSLGNVLLVQGEVDEAIYHYREALRIYPEYAQAHNNIGAILAEQGELDKAIKHYRQALQLNPGYEKARDNLEVALGKKEISKDKRRMENEYKERE